MASVEKPTSNGAATEAPALMMKVQAFGAVCYLIACPLLAVYPQATWFLPGIGNYLQEYDRLRHLQALCSLIISVGLGQVFGVVVKDADFTRVTMGWRLYYAIFFIVLCAVSFDVPLSVLSMAGSLDILIPCAITFLTEGESFKLTATTFFSIFLPPNRKTAHLRDWYAYCVAWLCIIISWVAVGDSCLKNGFFSSTKSSSVFTFALGMTGLPFFVLLYAAQKQTDLLHYYAAFQGVTLMGVAWWWKHIGIEEHVPRTCMTLILLVFGIYAYTLVWQRLVSPATPSKDQTYTAMGDQTEAIEEGQEGEKDGALVSPSLWMMVAACGLAVISTIWYSCSSLGFFSESAATLAYNIHEQDLLVAALAFGVGVAAMDLQDAAKKPLAEDMKKVVSWFLPMAAIYFTTETKMLAMLETGTPFHPSWTARHLAPRWADTEVINVTFWFATLLLTAFGTSFTCWFVARYCKCTEGWTWLTFNGVAIIFASGWFMALFISGVPPPMQAMAAATVPEFAPGASKVGAVATHKKDLTIGIAFLLFGPTFSRVLPEKPGNVVWLVIAAGWYLVIVGKVRLLAGMDQFDPAAPPINVTVA